MVPEPVLSTVLTEVEEILNSKPLRYVSVDATNPNLVTPYILLMGGYDPSLLQVIYKPKSVLGTCQWRHSQVLAATSGQPSSDVSYQVKKAGPNGGTAKVSSTRARWLL